MVWLQERRVVHMDLATRNILLTNPDELAKITDFGLSRIIQRNEPEKWVSFSFYIWSKYIQGWLCDDFSNEKWWRQRQHGRAGTIWAKHKQRDKHQHDGCNRLQTPIDNHATWDLGLQREREFRHRRLVIWHPSVGDVHWGSGHQQAHEVFICPGIKQFPLFKWENKVEPNKNMLNTLFSRLPLSLDRRRK